MLRAGALTLVFCLTTLAAAAQQQRHRGVDIVTDCAPCHGVDGIAKDRDVPHLAGQNEGYLFNQMKAFQSGRRPHKEMRFMARPLTEEEIRAIAAYFADLPPR